MPLPGRQSFTPSEFIRLAVAFFLAQYLAANARVLRNLRQPLGRVFPLNRFFVVHRPELVTLLTMLGLYGVFFFGLRDLGPAAIIFGLTLLCLYAATNLGLTPLLLLGAAVGAGSYHGQPRHQHLRPSRPDVVGPVGHDASRTATTWRGCCGAWRAAGRSGSARARSVCARCCRRRRATRPSPASPRTMGMWSGLALLLLFAALTWRGFAIARVAAG